MDVLWELNYYSMTDKWQCQPKQNRYKTVIKGFTEWKKQEV